MTGEVQTRLLYGTGVLTLCAAGSWLAFAALAALGVVRHGRRQYALGGAVLAPTLITALAAVAELFLIAALIGRSWAPLPWVIAALAACAVALYVRLAGPTRAALGVAVGIVLFTLALEGVIFDAFRFRWVRDGMMLAFLIALYAQRRWVRRRRDFLA